MREYFANALMIALALAFLVHFWLIWERGGYFITEPSLAILISEMVGMVAIIGFGIYNLM